MSKLNRNKVCRQYRLPMDQVLSVERYCLENRISKSKMVIMAIKKFLDGKMVKSLFVAVCAGLALANSAFAISDSDFATSTSVIAAFGGIIKMVAGIAAPVVTAGGLLVGGIMYKNHPEDAMDWIKGGIIGGVLAFGAWGLAKLFLGYTGM